MLTKNNVFQYPSRVVWRVLCLSIVIKIILSLIIPVTADEAYYAIWGIFPSWGGYDHTPFIGWLLYPFLWLSKNPVMLRLPNILATSIIGSVMYFFLKNSDLNKNSDMSTHASTHTKAALASIIFLLSPLSLCAVLITTDTPVILFSFLSGICVLTALKKNDHLGWFGLGGLFLGLAFFSKYFAVLLALSYGIYLIFVAPNRKRILGLLILFLGVLPFGIENIWWNYHHAWANILFNIYNRNPQSGFHFNVLTLTSYIISLFYILTPVLFYYFLKFEKKSEKNLLFYLIIAPLLFFLCLSAYRQIGLHWPLAFITFVYVWAGLYLSQAQLQIILKSLYFFTGLHVLLILLVIFTPLSAIQKLPISPKFYTKIVYFFKHPEINQYLINLNNMNLVFTSLNYVQADMLFYDTGHYAPLFGKGDVHGRQDDLLTDFKNYAHRNFLIFYTRLPRQSEYQAYFDKTELHEFRLYNTQFYYILGYNFRYPAYRDSILRHINQTYWQIPEYLPHAPSFFNEKYFQHS